MIPKDWLYIITPENKNFSILYAPIINKCIKISTEYKDEFNQILLGNVPDNSAQLEIYNTLIKEKFLTPPRSRKSVVKPSHKIFLSITNKCNMRCIYCYANSGEDNSTMSFDNAKIAIDYQIDKLLKSNDKQLEITFHGGGEAFVEFELMKKIVKYVNEKAKLYSLKPYLNCVTNATLINNDVGKWLSDNFNRLTVSLDGSEEVQNLQRPLKSSGESFKKTIAGIRNLYERNINFSIRSTITKYSVHKMAEFVIFLKNNIFENGGNVHFEPVSLAGRAKDDIDLAVNPDDFIKYYLEAKEIGKKLNIKVTSSLDLFGSFKYFYCGASSSSITCFTPDGEISGCTRVTKKIDEGSEVFYYGEIKNENVFINFGQKDKILNQGLRLSEECRACFARWNCQGGCFMMKYDDQETHVSSCIIKRKLLLFELINVVE